ncbi:alanine racemase [Rhizobiaceae bacterium n13]|uniref:Alanine racemase n=1 Tax=Ferirhizobium litorale TaxID=2927786 RepID=A0AAE3U1Q9_9HYPH|nr:alanine racemase [Fererhizobium litorale]MDI7861731.1 alanine racemase [Fererhizobium litorale]MDI7921927.1 alanine racemase [Fererhizobium litorale]
MINAKIEHDGAGACGLLSIDLGALRANYLALCRRTAPVKVAAVVKADAYGLGAGRVAPVLYAAGCRNFFVAHFHEALRLKPYIPSDADIYVLNGLQPGSEITCADAGIVPVLNSLEQLANWSTLGRDRQTRLPAALQFDTGMSRLGLAPEETQEIVGQPSLLDWVDVSFIMSHLACGDEPDNAANTGALANMREVAALFPAARVCFANSGGILLGTDFHGDLARTGIALYGGAPVAGLANPMKPVVRLSVRVIQTRTVPAGTAVGYGGAHVTKGETRLATISAGYADGLPRHLSDTGAAYFDGVRLPIVGRVSMDSMTLDVSALPESALKLGSLVELIGEHQTLEDIANASGTISYEILTRLGQRYHREYLPA